jgi:hypothetical protein
MREMDTRVNATNTQRIDRYAASSGKTASAVLNEALDFWYEMCGEIVQQEMDKNAEPPVRRRPISFPATAR